jgi:hypothetical protein
MCLIVTIIMIILAIQNLMQAHWFVGVVQLIIALGFLVLLLRNIQKARCDRDGSCVNGCSITDWISRLLPKKDEN